MIKGRSTGKIKCKEAVVIGKTLVYNRGVQAGREFSLPECILETDEFTLYKDGKHMIKVQEYRGHIRNWEALCEELCIDKSLSRREREERILVRAFETWQFDMAAHLFGMFAFALWDEEEKQLFCLRAVSYTHLDVYKRQAHIILQQKIFLMHVTSMGF